MNNSCRVQGGPKVTCDLNRVLVFQIPLAQGLCKTMSVPTCLGADFGLADVSWVVILGLRL